MLSSLSFASMADVTLYGEIKGGLEYTKVKHADNTVTRISDWDSRIGFKGSEELGEGFKGIWQIEQYVSLDSKDEANRSWSDRISFLGFETEVGTFRFGHLEDSVKSLKDVIDPWEGNGIRGLGHYTRTGQYLTSVRYDSPDFGGFNFNISYAPEDNFRYDRIRYFGASDDISAEVISRDLNRVTGSYKDTISAGLGYENNGFFGKYAYKNVKVKLPEADKDWNGQVHSILFGYDANNIYAVLGYQYTKDYDKDVLNYDYGILSKNVKVSEEALTISYDVGNVTPRLSYVHGEKKYGDLNNLKQKYDQVVLGADYNFSKRTSALISAGWLKNKRDKNSYSYNPATGEYSNDGLEAYTIGLGVRHKF